MAHEELRRTLIERRSILQSQIQSTIRDVRAEATGMCRQANDPSDPNPVDAEDDLTFALIQMKSQVLDRIGEAIRRMDAGSYGYCVECAGDIAPARLRALPFASRCKDCEELREEASRVRVAVPAARYNAHA